MASNETISVIIPVFNGAGFLADAMHTIASQTLKPDEIVIIDDGSTDGTSDLAASQQGNVRYSFQTNQGPAQARNKGLSLACGNFIAFLDVDDLWPEDMLHRQMSYLRSNPETDICLGKVQYMLFQEGGGYFPYSAPCLSYSLDAALFKRSVFQRIGGFDPTLRSGEDVDFFLRAREAGLRMDILPEVGLYYRIHPNNLSRNREESRSYFLKTLKKSIDRRRRHGHTSC